jgi:hypothetical protein
MMIGRAWICRNHGRWPAFFRHPPNNVRENVMKTLVSTIALLLAFAVTGPAFAGDVSKASNQADCEKAGGIWNAETSKCSEKGM